MDGVSSTIKEFSDDYDSMTNLWKYVVGDNEDEIWIKYLEKHDGNWIEISHISISYCVARRLFREVLEGIKNGEFGG